MRLKERVQVLEDKQQDMEKRLVEARILTEPWDWSAWPWETMDSGSVLIRKRSHAIRLVDLVEKIEKLEQKVDLLAAEGCHLEFRWVRDKVEKAHHELVPLGDAECE